MYVEFLPQNIFCADRQSFQGLACTKAYVVPAHQADLPIDAATSEAVLNLLGSEKAETFWRAASQLELAKRDGKSHSLKLTLPKVRTLMGEVCVALKLAHRWRGFKYLCS